MAELPTEEHETLKMEAGRYSYWLRILDSFKKIMGTIRTTLVALVVVGGTVGSAVYWGGDQVFATDAEVEEIQEKLSAEIDEVQDEIKASERRIKCDSLDRVLQDLKIERKVLLRMGETISPIDQEKFREYRDEFDRECTPKR